jgi:menaquinone-9 beta-reductase
VQSFDAIIVGGGPAGSSAARILVAAGMSVAVLDRAAFPRVKLCGGWLSPGVWDELSLSPHDYPGALWQWSRCHVQRAGTRHSVAGSGYFIRRVELDAFLLQRSGARVLQHGVRSFERREGAWLVDDQFRAPILIGAAGTHCPVARRAFRQERTSLVAAQEHEFIAGHEAVAAARVGLDGEPELLLHEDWGGYSWNVPKGEWLNVGTGTSDPRQVRAAWAGARDFFLKAGHVPASATESLGEARGHSYFLFDPAHLAGCERDGVLIVGDALGLAHPLTAEGILAAVLSARLAAQAVVSGEPSRYPSVLSRHELIRDYAVVHALLSWGIALKRRLAGRTLPVRLPAALGRFADAALARGFARLFSGRPLPGARALDLAWQGAQMLKERRARG